MIDITTKYDTAGGVELRKGTKSVYFQPGDDANQFEDDFEAFRAQSHMSGNDVLRMIWDQYEHIAQED